MAFNASVNSVMALVDLVMVLGLFFLIPGTALLMGLGGCFMSNLLAAALARDIKLNAARAEIEGDLADAPPRYTAIRMRVSGDCDPPAELAKLVTIAERGCIVANTLRNALTLTVEGAGS